MSVVAYHFRGRLRPSTIVSVKLNPNFSSLLLFLLFYYHYYSFIWLFEKKRLKNCSGSKRRWWRAHYSSMPSGKISNSPVAPLPSSRKTGRKRWTTRQVHSVTASFIREKRILSLPDYSSRVCVQEKKRTLRISTGIRSVGRSFITAS